MLRGTTLFPAPRPKTPRKTSPEGRPSAETPDPSAARAPRGPPHLGASAQRRHDRVKVNTAPRMPTVRSGSKPEGAIRQLPPGTGRREPTTPRLRPGTQNGTSPAFVPPSGSAPRPDPRSISAKIVLGRTTCGRGTPNRARLNTLLPRNRLIEMKGLRRHS